MAESKRSSGCGARRDPARSAPPRRLASRPSSSPPAATDGERRDSSGLAPATWPSSGARRSACSSAARAPPSSFSTPSPYDHREWDDEAAALAASHRVVTYDLRAHGASSPALEPFSRVDELEAVLDALDVERATLIGLSSGAEIALDFTLAHPARVEGLVLSLAGGERLDPTAPDDLVRADHRRGARRRGRTRRRAVRRLALDDLPRLVPPPGYGPWCWTTRSSGAAAAICSAPSRRPPTAGFAEVRVPALLLSGAHDPVRRSRRRRRARREASPRTPDRVSSGRSSPRL